MDQLKNMANKFASGSKTNNNAAPVEGGAPAGGAAPAGNAGKEDYLDKGKKFGYSGNRETNEKITDGIRGQFEKATGKKVPEKFSN